MERLAIGLSAATLTLTAALTGVAGTMSEATTVQLNAADSYLWSTIPSTTFDLHWNAASDVTGTLEVRGCGYAKTIQVSGLSCTLELPAATDAYNENVYDLTLTLSDGSVRTARLASVCGVGAGGENLKAAFRLTSRKRKWSRMTGRVVLPIPAGAESLTVDGEEVALGLNGAAGWYHFVTDELGEYELALDGATQTLRNTEGGLSIVIK